MQPFLNQSLSVLWRRIVQGPVVSNYNLDMENFSVNYLYIIIHNYIAASKPAVGPKLVPINISESSPPRKLNFVIYVKIAGSFQGIQFYGYSSNHEN